MNVREALNMLKWKKEFDFDKVEIWYIDRGAPNDSSVICGREIERIGRSFIYTKGKTIPFHRVIRVVYQDNIIFDRFEKKSKSD